MKELTAVLLTSILSLLLFSTSNAQLLPAFGLKGGVNFSTLNNADDVELKSGFIGGAYVKLNIPASPVSLQPELLFAQYGADSESGVGSLEINYIQVPVLLNFGFNPPASPIKPKVYFGPYLGFKTNAEADFEEISFDIDDSVKDTDFGVAVGAGVEISRFSIDLRYTAGLVNVFEDELEDGEKNGAIGLTVGIGLN